MTKKLNASLRVASEDSPYIYIMTSPDDPFDALPDDLMDDVLQRVLRDPDNLSKATGGTARRPDGSRRIVVLEEGVKNLAGVGKRFRRMTYPHLLTTHMVLEGVEERDVRAAATRLRMSLNCEALDIVVCTPDHFDIIFAHDLILPRLTSLTLIAGSDDIATPARLNRLATAFPSLQNLVLGGGSHFYALCEATELMPQIRVLQCNVHIRSYADVQALLRLSRSCHIDNLASLCLIVELDVESPGPLGLHDYIVALFAMIAVVFPNLVSLHVFEGTRYVYPADATKFSIFTLESLRSLAVMKILIRGRSTRPDSAPIVLVNSAALRAVTLRQDIGDPISEWWYELPRGSLPNLDMIDMMHDPDVLMPYQLKCILADAAPNALEIPGTLVFQHRVPDGGFDGTVRALSELSRRRLTGDALHFAPGCDFMEWARLLARTSMPTVRRLVITEAPAQTLSATASAYAIRQLILTCHATDAIVVMQGPGSLAAGAILAAWEHANVRRVEYRGAAHDAAAMSFIIAAVVSMALDVPRTSELDVHLPAPLARAVSARSAALLQRSANLVRIVANC